MTTSSTSVAGLGVQVGFHNINYSIEAADPAAKKSNPFSKAVTKEKSILNDISGVFRPGRLTAIMGASGAGKTSLLNVLAGHTDGGSVSGSVTVNKQPVSGSAMRKESGFVFQDDVILATMTAREAIAMSATLRLGDAVSAEEKERKVEEMLDLLNLRKCAHTVVGSPTLKGISGGERKRVAIAMELITEPRILYLDEPTSGLDSFTAYSVISILRNLATTGRTIACTIHQPSSEVFALFHDVLFLAEGQVMYNGPTSKVVDYFGRLGYPCPEHFNPADHVFMAILNNQEGSFEEKKEESNADRIKRLIQYWKDSPEAADLAKIRQNPPADTVTLKKNQTAGTSYSTQFKYLLEREFKNSVRNPLVLRAKAGQSLILALIIGLLFLNTDDKTGYAANQNRVGVLFFLSTQAVFGSTMSILGIFAADKLVFAREHGSGYYSLPAFFFSKIGVELPSIIVFPTIMATIIYWMVGLQVDAAKYLIVCAFVIMVSLTGFALGVSLASIFPSLPVALAVTPLLLLPLMLFSGLFINDSAIPAYFGWIRWLSPIRYSFIGLVKNEYAGLQIPQEDGTARAGESYIADLGFSNGLSILLCAVILVGMAVVLIAIAYAALANIVRGQENSKPARKGKGTEVAEEGAEMEQIEVVAVKS